MRTDFEPARTQRTALREGLATVAAGLLFPFGYLRSRHEAKRARDIRTLVFVHGLLANRSTFFPMMTYLRVMGHARQFSFNYESAHSIEAIALRLKEEIDRNVKGGRIDIIAHSMGGLVARIYLQQLGGARRVDRLITIGTPHHGTHASVYVPSALVRQLKPNSPFIEYLNSLPIPERLKITSIGADGDLMILPRNSALWPGTTGTMLSDHGHVSLLGAPSVFAGVRDALRSDFANADGDSKQVRADGHERRSGRML